MVVWDFWWWEEIDIDITKNYFEFFVQLFVSGYPLLNKLVLKYGCMSIAEFNKLKQKMVHYTA